MASKLVAASHSHILSSSIIRCYPTKTKSKTKSSEIRHQHYQQQTTWWVGSGVFAPSRSRVRPKRSRRKSVVSVSVNLLDQLVELDPISVYFSSDASNAIINHPPSIISSVFLLLSDTSSSTSTFTSTSTSTSGYSLASYYTSLGLFVISVPGLWSLIKRSVKSKVVQKTFFIGEGEGEGRKKPNQVAGEILSFFTRNNFVVSDRGETVTFEGMMVPSRGQAALLTFCTCISLASVALVLTITVPDVGNNWFWITILSPLAGAYYWKRASRKEQIKVKMMVGEDGTLSEIVVQGDDQQVEQMRKELLLSEKGMVYVKGLFER